jgi:hypothetical protein
VTGLTLTARGRRVATAARVAGIILLAAATAALFVLLIMDAAMYQ